MSISICGGTEINASWFFFKRRHTQVELVTALKFFDLRFFWWYVYRYRKKRDASYSFATTSHIVRKYPPQPHSGYRRRKRALLTDCLGRRYIPYNTVSVYIFSSVQEFPFEIFYRLLWNGFRFKKPKEIVNLF